MSFPQFLIIAVLFIAFCCFHWASPQGNRIDPELQKKIDDYINDVFLPSNNISGLGLTIVQNNEDDQVIYSTGFGMADIEKQIPNRNTTQFLIASVTKVKNKKKMLESEENFFANKFLFLLTQSFTSLLLVKLLNERFPELGESVLDIPIRKLLPEVDFVMMDR